MRRFALLLAGTLAAAAPTNSVILEWNAPITEDIPIGGYRLYRGLQSGIYTVWKNTGPTNSTTSTALTNGTVYFFAVAALSSLGVESDLSNEVQYTPTGTNFVVLPPSNLKAVLIPP